MPELPEVETIRRGLNPKIVGQTITEVEVRLPKIVRGSSEDLQSALINQHFSAIDRRGKLLILWLEDKEHALLIHLKMTGQLIYRHGSEQIAGGHPWPEFGGELPNKYSHVIFHFVDGGVLFFNDLRQFGYLQLVDKEDVAKIISQYGLEPGLSEFTPEAFLSKLEKRRGKLKAVLLDQKIFSGLGNIYVDESCFWAEVLPTRAVETLTHNERLRLHAAIVEVISKAIEHSGTTVHDFVDADGKRGNYSDLLMVYGRGGESCLRCGSTRGGVISKTKFAGRGTHFCPMCQI
jgi:formamidopyrimidine-DNA glycosylase